MVIDPSASVVDRGHDAGVVAVAGVVPVELHEVADLHLVALVVGERGGALGVVLEVVHRSMVELIQASDEA